MKTLQQYDICCYCIIDHIFSVQLRQEMLYLGLTQHLKGLQVLLLFWLEILLLLWIGLGTLCFLGLML